MTTKPAVDQFRPAVRWDGEAIEAIDQTALPAELRLLRLESVDDAIDAIKRLAIRGAPSIGACGALAMVLGLRELDQRGVSLDAGVLDELADRIASARPTAVNLPWAVTRVASACADSPDCVTAAEKALAEALAIIDEDRQACWRIGETGRQELAGKNRILTHCNTGRLATAGWGTALGVVYAKMAADEPVQVYACEARPLLQGARLTAWELMDAGIEVTLIADSAAAWLLHCGMVDAVIVGADRIAQNGDTANKIGTLSLAIAARQANIPFYVAAPLSTFDTALPTGEGCVIEERSANEVRTIGDVAISPVNVRVYNPAFDITPVEMIAGFITDAGMLQPPFTREALARAAAETKGLSEAAPAAHGDGREASA